MIKPEEIATLVEMFETSQWDELHVELNGMHLFLSTDPNARLATTPAPHQTQAPVALSAPAAQLTATSSAPVVPSSSVKPATADAVQDGWVAIAAPNLGTFYRSPKPGAAPFVEIGQTVEADAEICLLEVMKLFTAVRAGKKGIIRQICVADADMVEFGQPLFYIDPV